MTIPRADLVVVGAGPAGISAAAEVARLGMSVIVLDEHPTPGGRLLGQLHQLPGHGPDGWWRGAEIAREMVGQARSLGVALLSGVSVWGLRPGWEVLVTGADFPAIQADRVLIATGAVEKPIPLPGWTLPGVITAGAGQVFANVHRVRPGRRALMVGVDPLTITIARELFMAGVEVLGIALPPPGIFAGDAGRPASAVAQLARTAGLAPTWYLRLAGALFAGDRAALGAALYPAGGVKIWGIPLMLRQAAVEVLGTDEVTGAILQELTPTGELSGRRRELELDLVCVSGGLYPLGELAALAGCTFAVIPELGGRVPLCGDRMATTVPGIYVAGNIMGIEGAQVAAAQGRLAGLCIAADAGRLDGESNLLLFAREALAQVRRISPMQFHPRLEAGLTRMSLLWKEHERQRAAAAEQTA